jgi:ubiquinone/menaquinone biosynthesis C-methylase UbiE
MRWEKYYSKTVSTEHYISDVSNHRPFLFEIIRTQSRHGRLLEVGAGSGVLGIFLSQPNYEVISIDNNDGVLSVARGNNTALNGRGTFLKADAHSLPFPDNSFHVCFSQGFFEHFANYDICKLLAEQLRVAREVIFSVPTFWYSLREFGDERLIKREDWLKILRGFKVVKAVYYRYARQSAPACGEASQTGETRPLELYFKIAGDRRSSRCN